MSFFDDASLVFLPSGQAGKDGKAYSIKPVPEYGTNLVTNGGFDTDSDWTKSSQTTISNGAANILSTDGSFQFLKQSGYNSSQGKELKVTIDVVNVQSGQLKVSFSGGANSENVPNVIGTHNIYIVNDGTIGTLTIGRVSGVTDITIDNVSVREVIVDGDFTFSRGSNLTATRVDSNGLIEKGRENLLLQSNNFDTTWLNASTDETSGQSGYDGTNNAWLLDTTVDGDNRRIYQSVSLNGVQTFSFYAKAGTSEWCFVNIIQSATNANNYYHLSGDGSKGASPSVSIINETIESVGNGWYRISITGDLDTSQVRIQIANGDGDSSVVVGDNIYIQDAQLEIGLVATEYIESGATKGKAGLLEHSPRFDYSGGASCSSLLLEPSRTQLITQSEYFGAWSAFRATITDNSATSPEGVSNAAALTEDTTNNSHPLNKTFSVSSGAEYTLSIFAKQGSRRYLALLALNGGSTIYYDLENKTAGSGGSVEDYGNGWLRLIYTYTTNSTSAELYIQPSVNGSSVVYTGDGSNAVFLYGAQLEQGSYPTSYIPNHSGGTATRTADVTSVTSVSDLIGQTEGTIYCEFEYNGAADSGVFNRIIGLGTGVTQNRILLAKNNTTAELVAFAVTGGTTQVFQAISGTSIIGHHKVAISYKANEYKVYLDGELEFTDTSASVPATTDVYVGTAEDGTTDNELGGVVKQSIIFKEVLSEDNCKALTTI